MKKPTHEDAIVLIKLLEITNTPEMREAGDFFMKGFSVKDYKEFKQKYPPGSKEAGHINTQLGALELAGTLVSHGLLNENLYFDTSGIEFIWPTLAPLVAGMQKESGPALWENAAWLAQRHKKWKKKVWKPGGKWKTKT
ncbi:MAG TPA: hypothetical protein VEJ36_04435 [Nitrososphaerales archaeon]|nr:hypothetical protein [Nitrososphaerales archaeon]